MSKGGARLGWLLDLVATAALIVSAVMLLLIAGELVITPATYPEGAWASTSSLAGMPGQETINHVELLGRSGEMRPDELQRRHQTIESTWP